MKQLLLLLVFVYPFFAQARVVDLEDREGRRIRADVISLKDGMLTLRRVDSATLFYIPEDILSQESQAHLHAEMTTTMTPALLVESLGTSRKSTTHWRNSWGEFSKTTNVERAFGISVSSTSAFRKEVDVFVYWAAGGNLKYFVERGFAGGGQVIEFATSDSASERNTRYEYFSGSERYTSGNASVEMAVLVKDTDGNVLISWATSRALEAVTRRSNDKADPARIRKANQTIPSMR